MKPFVLHTRMLIGLISCRSYADSSSVSSWTQCSLHAQEALCHSGPLSLSTPPSSVVPEPLGEEQWYTCLICGQALYSWFFSRH